MASPIRNLLYQKQNPHGLLRDQPLAVQGADGHLVREFNRLLVLNCVREHGPLARVQIAHRLGLSRPTISSIIDVLLQERLVREGDLLDAAPAGGRRAMLVHFNADAGCIVGIDVGRTHLAMVMANLEARIIARRSGPFEMSDGPEICLPRLLQEVRAFVQDVGIAWEHVVGIGLGIPGPLDRQLHKLSSPPGMPNWDGADVWQALHQEFNVPVYLDNDANMGVLSESRYGAGIGSAYLVYVKVGTGIGAGFLLSGHIYRGNGGSAGELGHITIDENGPLCSCGNRGCLETFAGAHAIVNDASHGLSLARSESLINSRQVPALAGRSDIDITEVIQAARDGDAASRAALEHAGERIGVALAGLVNLFNPSTIVVGGGVARAGELFLNQLCQAASSRSLPAAWRGTRILSARLDDTAVALGAVSLVIDAAFGISTVGTEQKEQAELPGGVSVL